MYQTYDFDDEFDRPSRPNRFNDEINSVSALWGVSPKNSFKDDQDDPREVFYDDCWDDSDGYGTLYV